MTPGTRSPPPSKRNTDIHPYLNNIERLFRADQPKSMKYPVWPDRKHSS